MLVPTIDEVRDALDLLKEHEFQVIAARITGASYQKTSPLINRRSHEAVKRVESQVKTKLKRILTHMVQLRPIDET